MTSSRRSDRSRSALGHIRENIRLAQSFVAGLDERRFGSDPQVLHAVVRCLEIISEASRRLDAAVRARHPDLPWRDIATAGNIYRHVYDDVRTDLVWHTVQHDPPGLLAAVEAELAAEP